VGDVLELRGNGVPDSLAGISINNAVGNSKINERSPGEFAKRVIERRSGATRISHSAGNTRDLFVGRRDRKAEYRAMDDW
jgi:hypothetical protein